MKINIFLIKLTVPIAILASMYACTEEGVKPSTREHIATPVQKNKYFSIKGEVLSIKNWDVLDSLNKSLTHKEKSNYFNSKGYSFTSAEDYYNKAIEEIDMNLYNEKSLNKIEENYPPCLKFYMDEDDLMCPELTTSLSSLSWALNKKNQIIINGLLYTFDENKQTIKFPGDVNKRSINKIGNENFKWQGDVLEIKHNSSLKNGKFDIKWVVDEGSGTSGRKKLEAKLIFVDVYIINPTRYNYELETYQTNQVNEVHIQFKQKEKKWYGWTRISTRFSYNVEIYETSSEPYLDPWIETYSELSGSMYAKQGSIVIFSKKRTLYHKNENLDGYKKRLKFCIGVKARSRQVTTPFDLFFSDYPVIVY